MQRENTNRKQVERSQDPNETSDPTDLEVLEKSTGELLKHYMETPTPLLLMMLKAAEKVKKQLREEEKK